MSIILMSVTDAQLVVSQIVKSILLAAILAAAIINLRSALKHPLKRWKYGRVTMALILTFLTLPIIKWLKIDGAMLRSNEYVAGRTIELCEVFARGQGIKFEYVVDGHKYSNCNTFHPMNIENIKIPDGYYFVRYSSKYPSRGRIDFERVVK